MYSETRWLRNAVATASIDERPIFPWQALAAGSLGCALIMITGLWIAFTESAAEGGVAAVLFGLAGCATGMWAFRKFRTTRPAAGKWQSSPPKVGDLKWEHIYYYLESPQRASDMEDQAADAALTATHRIARTTAWASPLLDKYGARIDMLVELHAVLDAAQDIASVRRTVGPRPPETYAHQWQIDTDALDHLGQQVMRRTDVLRRYEETIARVQATLDDIAYRNHRQTAATAVDDLVSRRGAEDLATDIAAGRAAEAEGAEAAVQFHLQAAYAIKTEFDQPFILAR